jgi:transposase
LSPGRSGVVDEDVDAAVPGSRGLGDLIDRGVVGQIRLDGEQFGRLSLLTRGRRKGLQRLTIAIDGGDLDACRQKATRHRPADATRGTVTIATLWVSLMACFLPLACRHPEVDPVWWSPSGFSEEASQMPKTRPPYAPEFRRQMVELVRAGRDPAELAREFEPTAQSISHWVAQADRQEGRREEKGNGLSAAEREELARLRRENKQLRLERDILSRAAAWFARETGAIPPGSSNS